MKCVKYVVGGTAPQIKRRCRQRDDVDRRVLSTLTASRRCRNHVAARYAQQRYAVFQKKMRRKTQQSKIAAFGDMRTQSKHVPTTRVAYTAGRRGVGNASQDGRAANKSAAEVARRRYARRGARGGSRQCSARDHTFATRTRSMRNGKNAMRCAGGGRGGNSAKVNEVSASARCRPVRARVECSSPFV